MSEPSKGNYRSSVPISEWLKIPAAIGAAWLLVLGCRHDKASSSGHAGNNFVTSLQEAAPAYYWTNFSFVNFNIDRENFGGVWGAAFNFGVKNNGSRAVTGLKVTVSLTDTNGSECGQQTVVPFSDQTNSPLLPGRSWFSDPKNPYIIVGVPDSWLGDVCSAKVTEVKVLDQP